MAIQIFLIAKKVHFTPNKDNKQQEGNDSKEYME